MHPEFIDSAHLTQLRSLLWQVSSQGRASVMVGAGMSRNAVPLRPDQPLMPLWGALCAAMAKETWGTDSLRRDTDALLVAEYFERVHGRAALDTFLRQQIRDADFVPSRLHLLLMALPWVDVFTTNYDTLLERASHNIIARRYRVLVNESDLAGSIKPRIVKLHGSFPSYRPFIITKEDYRTYPRRFPAFVNTVQQAIMETALCMIGFSGDDPNFEAWTGWVRDNLGSAAPPIYFCGILDLDNARRSYYESRNIKTINLSPLFPKDKWPAPDARHAAATEWLLLSLAEGAPMDPMFWPTTERRLPPLPLAELVSGRAVKRTRNAIPSEEEQHPSDHATSSWRPSEGLPPLHPSTSPPALVDAKTEVEKIRARASFLRSTYPSWLISPNTTSFFYEVRDWYSAFKEVDSPSLELVHAIAWAFDILHWPLTDKLLAKAESFLENLHEADFYAERLALLRWVIREAREKDDNEAFQRWMAVFRRVSRNSAGLAAEWWLEKAKFHFMRLEVDETENALARMAAPPVVSFVDVSRAALMFEMGQFRGAAELAARAVDEIRRHAPLDGSNLRALGEEASALDLAMNATLAAEFGRIVLDIGRQRREELRRTGADPQAELNLLGLELAKSRPPERSMTKSFDPNRYTIHVRNHFGSEHLEQFKYLRALDMAAQLPSTHADHVRLAADGVATERPGLAFSFLIRAGCPLDRAFSRHAVLALSEPNVHVLWDRCMRFLRWLLDQQLETEFSAMDSFLKRATRGAMELLSRLTLRSTETMRMECLELALSLYESSMIRTQWHSHEWLANLFNRLFLAMSFDEVANALPRLIDASVPGAEGSSEVWEQFWQEPCQMLCDLPLGQRLLTQRATIRQRILQLIDIAKSSSGHTRAIAVQRIAAVRKASGLDDTLLESYADAIWTSPEAASSLIPHIDGFFLHFGLSIPSSERHNAMQRFITWATTTPLPALFVEEPLPSGMTHNSNAKQPITTSQAHWVQLHILSISNYTPIPGETSTSDSQGIDWTSSQALSLLGIIESWIQAIQPYLNDNKKDGLGDQVNDTVQKVANFVAACLVSRLDGADPSIRQRLKDLNALFCMWHVVSLDTHITWCAVDPNAPIVESIEAGLSSLQPDVVRQFAWIVSEWAKFSGLNKAPTIPESIVEHLLLLASVGEELSRISAFGAIREVFFHLPSALGDHRVTRLKTILTRTLQPVPSVVNDREKMWSIEHQGDLRAAAAEVLVLVALSEETSSEEMRSLLKRAENDVFPEVRRACQVIREQLFLKAKKPSAG